MIGNNFGNNFDLFLCSRMSEYILLNIFAIYFLPKLIINILVQIQFEIIFIYTIVYYIDIYVPRSLCLYNIMTFEIHV